MKKIFGKYYLGLDIGTDSIGWSVTDENYKVLKFNGKAMWGVHLFESGQTAKERRLFRCARRRTARRKQRIDLLSSLFSDEILKKDSNFFQRLEDSTFWEEDKKYQDKNTLFSDKLFTDKDFHRKYPTIYHLRSELIHSKEAHDVRLVYLALHHIIKHRGHFLFEGQDFKRVTSFNHVFHEVLNALNDHGIDFGLISPDEVKEVLKNKELNVTQKKKKLNELMNVNSKEEHDQQKKSVIELIAGSKVSLSKLFQDESLEDSEIPKISFSEEIDEDMLTDILEDRMYLVLKIKTLYDWSVLTNILQESAYLCDAKKRIFEEHRNDLKILKSLLKTHGANAEYKEILKSDAIKNNYNAYIGKSQEKSCGQKEFCTFLKAKLKGILPRTEQEKNLLSRIEENCAFPKQVSKDNGVIPYQLHFYELEEILENAKQYLPFLKEVDDTGLNLIEKIKSLFLFRIPYYVGPLNSHSPFAWIKKYPKAIEEKIYPWNFDQVVDKQKSAESFILRMTNPCTYVKNEKVLPKQSILYSKYNILNQLNNLRVNGEKLSVEVKQSLYNDLFVNVEKTKKITTKKLADYFKSKGYFDKGEIDVTGVDNEVVGNLKALIDFKHIMEECHLNEEVVDEIIEKIVILGESKDILKEYLQREYSDILGEKHISEIIKLNYSGWGRFSRAFLTQIQHLDKVTGEYRSILKMLWETDCNLMQLLSNEYDFIEEIQKVNSKYAENPETLQYSIVDELYVSPAVKRSIWRTLLISKEIRKITGHEPEKIFIEMARGTDAKTPKGKRTQSRKERLMELLESCKQEEVQLWEELEQVDEGTLRDNRLYLYYTQLGRCMYSNEKIDLKDLETGYDIDHIYPQSRVKDDSILANLVLVKKQLNSDKGNEYPIPQRILSENTKKFWFILLKKQLITKEKYHRLTRKTSFNEQELSGFIARQLVETRQSTKAVAGILKEIYKESKIVYVKAENVSAFRQKYGLVKSRLVNDYHHAKDAYLNIVVGNVYHEKFTSNPLNFIKKGYEYSLNQVFEYSVKKGNRMIWDNENKSARSLIAIKNQVSKNNVLFTRYSFIVKGGLFDQMPVKAGKGQFPLKTSDERFLQKQKYGAYNKVAGSYFFLVEYKEEKITKKKTQELIKRSIEFVPVYMINRIKTNEDLLKYTQDELKLKDAKILIPKIKINTLFCVNGFKMHLSGRTGNRLILKGAMPLVISDKLYEYTRKIEKYIERNIEKKKVYPITEHQKITAEQNLELYDVLLDKLKNTIYYSKLSSQVSTFEKGRDKFIDLDLTEQCQLLYNSFKLFDTTASLANLLLIGGVKNAGALSMSGTINDSGNLSIIEQSITGLFEKKKDISTL